MKLYRYLTDRKLEWLLEDEGIHQSPLSNWESQDNPEGLSTFVDELKADGGLIVLDVAFNVALPSIKPKTKEERQQLRDLDRELATHKYSVLGKHFFSQESNLMSTLEKMRGHIYMSSWTKGVQNETVMWERFGYDNAANSFNSVRIETSLDRLDKELVVPKGITVIPDHVSYRDYDTDITDWNGSEINPYFSKPKVYKGDTTNFAEEDEFRLVSFKDDFDLEDTPADYMKFKVDLGRLIKKIEVSPKADVTYRDEVEEKLKSLNLKHLLK